MPRLFSRSLELNTLLRTTCTSCETGSIGKAGPQCVWGLSQHAQYHILREFFTDNMFTQTSHCARYGNSRVMVYN